MPRQDNSQSFGSLRVLLASLDMWFYKSEIVIKKAELLMRSFIYTKMFIFGLKGILNKKVPGMEIIMMSSCFFQEIHKMLLKL